jgi:D-sedoheptulose 7-phosphate isomerase
MTNGNNIVEAYFDHYTRRTSVVPKLELEHMANIIWDAGLPGGTVHVFGNGACATLAAHMATNLSKGTAVELGTVRETSIRPRIRIVILSDNTALLTACGNDLDWEYVYVEQPRRLLHAGDVVMALSGSGGSPNVLRALDYAKAVGIRRLGLTGRQNSAIELVSSCEVAVQAPSSMMEHIEDWHVIYNHVLTLLLRKRLHTYVDSESGRI